MNARAESHSVPIQLRQLRRVFENWATKPATGADIVFAYVTLCTAIEFTVGHHIRTELDKLQTLVELTQIKTYFGSLNRMDENGQSQPYDESVGKGIFLRMIYEEQSRAEQLTFGNLTKALSVLRETTMTKLCNAVDGCLWGDLQGLSALRNVYAHGRPIRLDEDNESNHHIEASGFSLREVIKSLRRMKIISDEGTFFERAGKLYDVLGSTMCISFYWRRAGQFISSYVAGIPYDAAYHPQLAGILEAVKPLEIDGADCL